MRYKLFFSILFFSKILFSSELSIAEKSQVNDLVVYFCTFEDYSSNKTLNKSIQMSLTQLNMEIDKYRAIWLNTSDENIFYSLGQYITYLKEIYYRNMYTQTLEKLKIAEQKLQVHQICIKTLYDTMNNS